MQLNCWFGLRCGTEGEGQKQQQQKKPTRRQSVWQFIICTMEIREADPKLFAITFLVYIILYCVLFA